MKRCPECRRDYYDETLLYCLDDGAHLLDGPATAGSDGPATAILHETTHPNETATRQQIHTTDAATSLSFGHTPKRSAKPLIAIAGAVFFLFSAFAAYKFFVPSSNGQIGSVVVLPFVNAGGDPDQDYLSDGISEAVINSLSQLKDLKVIARSSAFQYKGKELNLDDIAKTLGVEAVVTGRVVKRGDQLQISAELVKVSDKSQLWGETFTRRAAEAGAIEAELSKQIAERLKQRLTNNEAQQFAKGSNVNPEAHDLYLRAQFSYSKSGSLKENNLKAIDLFNQAIAIDPNYALAYLGLATCYRNLVANSFLDPKVGNPKAEEALKKVLELDDKLPEAYVAVAGSASSNWNWAEAESAYKRSLELNPNMAIAHFSYGYMLDYLGRHDDAIAHKRTAKELDPANLSRNTGLAVSLYFARRYDEAIDLLKKTLELDTELSLAHSALGYAYSAKGNYELAISEFNEAMRIDGANPSDQCFLGAALAKAGRRDEAILILRELENSKEYVSPTELAILYSGLNEKEKAFVSLERAFAARDLQMRYIGVDPSFDALRSDARFSDLIRRVGLPQNH